MLQTPKKVRKDEQTDFKWLQQDSKSHLKRTQGQKELPNSDRKTIAFQQYQFIIKQISY